MTGRSGRRTRSLIDARRRVVFLDYSSAAAVLEISPEPQKRRRLAPILVWRWRLRVRRR